MVLCGAQIERIAAGGNSGQFTSVFLQEAIMIRVSAAFVAVAGPPPLAVKV